MYGGVNRFPYRARDDKAKTGRSRRPYAEVGGERLRRPGGAGRDSLWAGALSRGESLELLAAAVNSGGDAAGDAWN